MRINNVLSLTVLHLALLSAAGCGSSGGSNNEPAPPTDPIVTPTPIEDIDCSVSYPLAITDIYEQTNKTSLPALHDLIKTNDSSWQATNADSVVVVELEEPGQLKELVITWRDMNVSHLFEVYASKDAEHWDLLDGPGQSQKQQLIPDLVQFDGNGSNAPTARYIKLELAGNELSMPSELVEIEAFGCAKEVAHNIELIDWYLSVPTDEDGNGRSDSISETALADGYFDPRFFSLSESGGLIFSTSVSGYKTSTNTKYVRSELREMLRRGNTSYKTQGVNQNNWVFSSAPQSDLDNAGGIDGLLEAELEVNHVTTTGEAYQVGRLVIGQIHANDDEPIRLYYRKLPDNTNGSVYFAHEIQGGDDINFEMIGSRDNDADNPENGIPLNEPFSYSINVEGNVLSVIITKNDGTKFEKQVDMSASGYDVGGQYMYFKAGVYHLNNSGDQHDYVKATFYKIENSHNGYLE